MPSSVSMGTPRRIQSFQRQHCAQECTLQPRQLDSNHQDSSRCQISSRTKRLHYSSPRMFHAKLTFVDSQICLHVLSHVVLQGKLTHANTTLSPLTFLIPNYSRKSHVFIQKICAWVYVYSQVVCILVSSGPAPSSHLQLLFTCHDTTRCSAKSVSLECFCVSMFEVMGSHTCRWQSCDLLLVDVTSPKRPDDFRGLSWDFLHSAPQILRKNAGCSYMLCTLPEPFGKTVHANLGVGFVGHWSETPLGFRPFAMTAALLRLLALIAA